jgi:hypothetical protein
VAGVSFNNVAKVYPDGTRAVWELDLEVERPITVRSTDRGQSHVVRSSRD